jgi:hypothetical protein
MAISFKKKHTPNSPSTSLQDMLAIAVKHHQAENFDEAIVQYVMGRIDIARIAVTYRQHLLGVEGV